MITESFLILEFQAARMIRFSAHAMRASTATEPNARRARRATRMRSHPASASTGVWWMSSTALATLDFTATDRSAPSARHAARMPRYRMHARMGARPTRRPAHASPAISATGLHAAHADFATAMRLSRRNV